MPKIVFFILKDRLTQFGLFLLIVLIVTASLSVFVQTETIESNRVGIECKNKVEGSNRE